MAYITDLIKANKRGFSLEIQPPERYKEKGHYAERIDPLMRYTPSFATITYHQEKMEEHKMGKNVMLKPMKVRVGPDIIAAYLQGRYPDIPFAPHFICGGFTKKETESAAVQIFYVVDNLVLIRGDANYGNRFKPDPEGHAHASGLIAQFLAMERGQYLDRSGPPVRFCKGFAGYPEKHYASPNLDACIERLKEKQDAGGDFMITQICFDNDALLRFRDSCARHGVTVPVIPGIKTLDGERQMAGESGLPANFSITVPQALCDLAARAGVMEAGRLWAVQQAEGLYREGFPIVHLYSMNKPETITPVLDALGFASKA